MSTQFKNAADAAAHLADDKSIADEVREEIKADELLSSLISMRLSKGLTQDQIAKSMAVDPSTISRLESGSGRELKWSDIMGYVAALPDVHMGIMFDDDSLPAAVRIKQCVLKIDCDLKHLAQIAQQFDGNSELAENINRFYREVLFNFLLRYTENQGRLNNFISIRTKEPSAPPKELEPQKG